MDDLDRALVRLFSEEPRIGVLEASRRLKVARGTVQSRLDKLVELRQQPQRRGGVAGGLAAHHAHEAGGIGDQLRADEGVVEQTVVHTKHST